MINSLLPLEPMFALGSDAEVGLINKTILYDGSKFEELKDKCYVAVKKFQGADSDSESNKIGPSQISTLCKCETADNKKGCLFTTENNLNHIIVFNSDRLDDGHTDWYNTTVFFWNLTPIYITKEGSFSFLYSNNSNIYHSQIRLIPQDKIENIDSENGQNLASKIFEKVADVDLPTETDAAAVSEEGQGQQDGQLQQPQQEVQQLQQEQQQPEDQTQSNEVKKSSNYETLSFSHVASKEYIYQAIPTSSIEDGWYYPVLCKKVDQLEFKFHQFIYVK